MAGTETTHCLHYRQRRCSASLLSPPPSPHIICTQVAAQTGHQVCLVDVSQEVLQKAEDRIKTSLKRVAKKNFAEDPKVPQLYPIGPLLVTLLFIF